jgi:hypothetical protein
LTTKKEIAARLAAQLDAADEVRAKLATEPKALEWRHALRAWQSERLTRTHADLLQNPRYHDTASFFLSDIYGPKDLHEHLDAVRGLVPLITRTLPAAGLETVAAAVELNTLSESLDADMATVLKDAAFSLTLEQYVDAYRRAGRKVDRERQIDLILELGYSLDRLTRRPYIGAALSLMRKPAELAGLGELQNFLVRGYAAFRKMGGAQEFLETIASRERALLESSFAQGSGADMGSGKV